MNRIDLLAPTGDVVDTMSYNKLFTVHGVVMLFFLLVPSNVVVMGNFLVPLMIGARFMGINGVEYYHHYVDQLVPGSAFHVDGQNAHSVQLFMMLCFAMTGLHAIRLTIGIMIVLFMLPFTWKGRVSPSYWTPMELTGLYWHFVDIVWVILFTLLYLIHPAD